jgi:hypothetical protein
MSYSIVVNGVVDRHVKADDAFMLANFDDEVVVRG